MRGVSELGCWLGMIWVWKTGWRNKPRVPTTHTITKIHRNIRSTTMATYFQSSITCERTGKADLNLSACMFLSQQQGFIVIKQQHCSDPCVSVLSVDAATSLSRHSGAESAAEWMNACKKQTIKTLMSSIHHCLCLHLDWTGTFRAYSLDNNNIIIFEQERLRTVSILLRPKLKTATDPFTPFSVLPWVVCEMTNFSFLVSSLLYWFIRENDWFGWSMSSIFWVTVSHSHYLRLVVFLPAPHGSMQTPLIQFIRIRTDGRGGTLTVEPD